MRAKYKSPTGTGIIELGDDATVQTLFDELRGKTGHANFTIRYGPPMAMKTLSLDQREENAKALGLHGQSLTIVPEAVDNVSPVSPKPHKPRQSEQAPEDINVPWPEREGILLLRVMPSDNSCLFTAFGGALPKQIPAPQLRRMMADYILEHSDVYSEAVLGSPPSQYCRSIQDPDRWGGGIELSILSSIFDIQICTYDVQAQNLINFGEQKQDRCILVYSGIHYDRVAFSYSDFPFETSSLPPEMDRTIWPTHDSDILEKTQALVKKLHAVHYYTDTEGLILKCDVPGCGWIGSGQADGRKHAEQTGHVDLSEVADIEEGNVLRSCDFANCGFIGQGDKAMRQHRTDSGHKHFSIIPDS